MRMRPFARPVIMGMLATGAVAAVLAGPRPAAGRPARAADARSESNRRVVLAFYEAGLNRKDFAAASRWLGARYTQHNPSADDGREGFARFLNHLRSTYPAARSVVRRSFADGDFVILHVLERLRPGDRGNAIVDIFRLERGRIVEHWDVKQPIPDHASNRNGMF